MKKLIAFALCAMVALSMFACGNNTDPEAVPGSNSGVQIPNPFMDCSTMRDAGEIAGFDMVVPEGIAGYDTRSIQAVEDSMIQVIYYAGEQGGDEIRIRKSAGSDDISGDYNTYAEEDTTAVGEREVTVKGNDGKVYLATWVENGQAFSVSVSAGTNIEGIASLVEKVK